MINFIKVEPGKINAIGLDNWDKAFEENGVVDSIGSCREGNVMVKENALCFQKMLRMV